MSTRDLLVAMSQYDDRRNLPLWALRTERPERQTKLCVGQHQRGRFLLIEPGAQCFDIGDLLNRVATVLQDRA